MTTYELEKAKNSPLYEYYDPMTGNFLIPVGDDDFIVINDCLIIPTQGENNLAYIII